MLHPASARSATCMCTAARVAHRTQNFCNRGCLGLKMELGFTAINELQDAEHSARSSSALRPRRLRKPQRGRHGRTMNRHGQTPAAVGSSDALWCTDAECGSDGVSWIPATPTTQASADHAFYAASRTATRRLRQRSTRSARSPRQRQLDLRRSLLKSAAVQAGPQLRSPLPSSGTTPAPLQAIAMNQHLRSTQLNSCGRVTFHPDLRPAIQADDTVANPVRRRVPRRAVALRRFARGRIRSGRGPSRLLRSYRVRR